MILFIIGILFILIIVIITLIYFRKNNNDNLSMLIDRYGTHDLSSEMGYEWNNAHNLYKTLILDKNTYEVKVFFKIHVPSDLISEVESFSKGIEYNSINNEVLIIGNDIYSILAKIIGIILISHRVRPAIYEEIYEKVRIDYKNGLILEKNIKKMYEDLLEKEKNIYNTLDMQVY